MHVEQFVGVNIPVHILNLILKLLNFVWLIVWLITPEKNSALLCPDVFNDRGTETQNEPLPPPHPFDIKLSIYLSTVPIKLN